MKIKTNDKTFVMRIIGYEFLNPEHLEDLDWLIVAIKVKDNDSYWKAVGPYLRVNELSKCANLSICQCVNYQHIGKLTHLLR